MPPSETCAGTTPEDEYANMLLQPLRVEIRTARLALKYYHILHKVAKLEPVRMPSNPQYICAFIASENYQNGNVLAFQAIEARDGTKPKAFWKATEIIEDLLTRAAADINTFDYIPLPRCIPKCRRCSSHDIPCLQTSCIHPNGTIHPEIHSCQACYARGVRCEPERLTKGVASRSVPTVNRQTAADCDITSSELVESPKARSLNGLDNSSTSNSKSLQLVEPPRTRSKDNADDDSDDDTPLRISSRLRRRFIEGAERDKASKRRRVISVASTVQTVSTAPTDSKAIRILPPLPTTLTMRLPNQDQHRTPIPSSSQPRRGDSPAASPTPTPSSLSGATCIGQSPADAYYVASLCDRIREIADYVRGHGCEDYQLRTFIRDAMDALQDFGGQASDPSGQPALQHDETALSTFEFALGRVVSRLQSMEVPMKDGKLALLLRGLRRELRGKD